MCLINYLVESSRVAYVDKYVYKDNVKHFKEGIIAAYNYRAPALRAALSHMQIIRRVNN